MTDPSTHGLQASSAQDTDLPFFVRDLTLHSELGDHGALVMTPKKPMVIGRERLEQLRGSTGISPVERRIVEQIRNRDGRVHVLLFRAINDDGARVWTFDPALSEDELVEAGCVMCRAILPFYRRIVKAGVVQMVHTDWGLPECHGFRSGMAQLLDQLRATGVTDDAVHALDLWILEHLLLHAALSLQHVVDKLLPGHLRLIERRRDQLQPLLARLPAEAID